MEQKAMTDKGLMKELQPLVLEQDESVYREDSYMNFGNLAYQGSIARNEMH